MNDGDLLKEANDLYWNKKEYNKAFDYYLYLSNKDDMVAMNNLGFMYERGEGVRQDYQKAFEYYSKAAKKDHSSAISNLAGLYLNGLGVKKDKEKAINLLEKAAKLGNKQAADDLYWLTHPESKENY
ncbi:tetratricopeptide repeat protein [Xenorhabdus sp. TS4]|uniref:tetratricopeptide repeat protein n=1 Tax=Xenorhabdus sp. TS4 TaxID=1873483 RepID=UPI00165718E8|nr:tetratricopeptide repeat protein [Xenorhabdus sp. TS4]